MRRQRPHFLTHGLGKQALRSWLVGATAVALTAIAWKIHGTRTVSPPTAPDRHYVTGTGELKRITLPDGTRLTLAPRSVARTRGRELWLTGQSFVEVAPSSRATFVVHTGPIATRVLGTSFDVRHYANDTAVRVTVFTGKVAIHPPNGAAVPVSAGVVAIVSDSTATTRMAETNALDETRAWTDGRLVFRRVRVDELFATVGHWYGYDFRIEDSVLVSQKVTATFDNWPAADVMRELQELLHVTLTFDKNIVTVRRAQSTPQARPAVKRRATFADTLSMEVGR